MESKTRKILGLGLSGIVVVSVILIVIFMLPPLTPPPGGGGRPINLWTWVSGNYSINNKGTYGTKGVADAANVPGARYFSVSWTDANGNLWLFGGYGYDNLSLGRLNDLWMF